MTSDKRHISITRRSKKQVLGSLSIAKDDLVMEIGSGDKPVPRSDVLCDKYVGSTPTRGREIIIDNRPFIVCDAQRLPFKDKSFDYIIACQILEHLDDPDSFLKELMRVGKRGYIEVTGEIREVLFDWDARNFVASIDEQGRLIIRKKIGRGPFGNVFRKIQDRRLNTFINDNWSVFNYSLEWERKIDYVIDKEGIEVTRLQKELEIELDSEGEGVQGNRYLDLLWAIWAITPSFIQQAVRLARKAIKSAGRQPAMPFEELLEIMACPVCKGSVRLDEQKERIECLACRRTYPILYRNKKRIPVMLENEATVLKNIP